ncbi:MAG: hypothetical protein ACJ748_11650 [Flavisolibacter sp.]
MKSFLPLLSAVLILASCSTYKSGQTPDDVYFSPARPSAEYVTMDNKDNKEYRSDDSYSEDQYLRMKVQNHRFSAFDDDWYSYNPSYYYSLNNSIYYNNPYNYNPYVGSYHGFGNYYGSHYYNYYNPYYTGLVMYTPAVPVYNKPRRFNLNAYNPPANRTNTNGHGTRTYTTNTGNNSNTNYRNSGSNAGNFLRNIFNSGGSNSSSVNSNNSNNSSGSTSRSSSSNSGSSSSGSSGGSGHASVRRF